MSIDEFKAWLEGFEHSFEEQGPDDEQWQEIKKKVSELGKPSKKEIPPVTVGGGTTRPWIDVFAKNWA